MLGWKQGGRSLAALATFVCAVLVIAVVVHDNHGREELMGSWMHDHSANPSKLHMLFTPEALLLCHTPSSVINSLENGVCNLHG